MRDEQLPDLTADELALLTVEEQSIANHCHEISDEDGLQGDVRDLLAALVQARREHVKQLALIGGMCGHPDAAEACRLIAKKCHDLTAACWPGTEPG